MPFAERKKKKGKEEKRKKGKKGKKKKGHGLGLSILLKRCQRHNKDSTIKFDAILSLSFNR